MSFPPSVGVKLPPCPPGDEWCLLGSKAMKLSFLGTPLFMALPPELLSIHVGQRAGSNMAYEKKTLQLRGGQGRTRPHSTVPILSVMHQGQTGHLSLPLQLSETCSSEKVKKPSGQKQGVEIKRRKR